MNYILFQLINSWAGQNPLLDKLMVFAADKFGYVLIASLGVFLWFERKKYRPMVILALVSAFVSRFIFVVIIRYFYHHPRPFVVLQSVHLLLPKENEYSFPSGHAAFYFALAMAVWLYNKKYGWLYLTAACLMGFARIYGGVHWPYDIVAGAVLGILTAVAFNFFQQKMPRRALSGESSLPVVEKLT